MMNDLTNTELIASLSMKSVIELAKSHTRAELDEIYKTLTGCPCRGCRDKFDVAKWIVRFVKEQSYTQACKDIVV